MTDSAMPSLKREFWQQDRLLKLHFPRNDAPEGQLFANRLQAHESLSRDFHFTVELISDRADIPLKEMTGKMLTLELQRTDGGSRYFNGYVFDFRFVRSDAGFAYYDAVLLPWLAFLRLRRDNYLFHNQTVEDQTREIFADYSMADWRSCHLAQDAAMSDACQFDESDYNYLHRRWETLGWHYWYEHRKDGHTLVLSGDSTQAAAIEGGPVRWQSGATFTECGLQRFAAVRRLAPTQYAGSSFDFKDPRAQTAQVPTLNQQGHGLPPLEVYEYTGALGFRDAGQGENFVRLRMEELEASAKHFEGSGNDARLQPGCTMTLESTGAGLADPNFLILDTRHEVSNNYELSDVAGTDYGQDFTCIRKRIPWRPGRGFNSTEPKIYGLQTAIVTGPAGEDIYTDEFGRVKVQFHWDRAGNHDEKSSAWVRVASTWAGSNFGFVALPRIGQEVIVQWLDGNPDRPLITGSVFNQHNMPPWELPANKTQSGLMSRSVSGGTADNANALRFEDKNGAEEIWLHAERNLRSEIENDASITVGHDRTKTVDNDETVHVRHDRTETVDNNETITIGNDRTESVGSNETLSVGGSQHIQVGAHRTEAVGGNETVQITGNRSVSISGMKTETIALAKAETIGLGKALSVGLAYQTSVGAAMNTTVALSQSAQIGMSKSTSVGKSYTLGAGDFIEFRCGASVLRMDSSGKVTLRGTEFLFDASGAVQINGKDIDLN